jgi:cyanophycinase
MARPLRHRLLVIGGGEGLLGSTTVLRRFIRLAGGPGARIAVVSAVGYGRFAGDDNSAGGNPGDDDAGDNTAGEALAETVRRHHEALRRFGPCEVQDVGPADLDGLESAGLIAGAAGVLVVGRGWLEPASVADGTALGSAVRAAYRRGAVVAAGSEASAGLGLLPEVLIDHSFNHRSGHGRLLGLVARSPDLIGLGVEEETAVLVTEGRDLEVIGGGAAYVVDTSAAVVDADEPARGRPLLVSGAVVHNLPAGTKFDLTQRASTSLTHRRAGRPVNRIAGP